MLCNRFAVKGQNPVVKCRNTFIGVQYTYFKNAISMIFSVECCIQLGERGTKRVCWQNCPTPRTNLHLNLSVKLNNEIVGYPSQDQ